MYNCDVCNYNMDKEDGIICQFTDITIVVCRVCFIDVLKLASAGTKINMAMVDMEASFNCECPLER